MSKDTEPTPERSLHIPEEGEMRATIPNFPHEARILWGKSERKTGIRYVKAQLLETITEEDAELMEVVASRTVSTRGEITAELIEKTFSELALAVSVSLKRDGTESEYLPWIPALQILKEKIDKI